MIATISATGGAIVAVIAGITTILVGGLAIARWAWRRFMTTVVQAVTSAHNQSESLRRIERQVTPNGGNTGLLGDRVVRLEARQASIEQQVRALRREIRANQ